MGYQKQVLIFLITLVLTPLVSGSDEVPESFVIAPDCTSTCGGIAIPYPFGIEEGCYYRDKDDPSAYPMMRLTCDHTFNPPKLFLGSIPILNISLQEGEISLNIKVAYECDNPPALPVSKSRLIYSDTFTISSSKNKFVATGCDTFAWFEGTRYDKNYFVGCMTTCSELSDVATDGSICNGVGCCEASIPDGVTNLRIEANSFYNHTEVEFNPCSVAYPVAKDAFYFSTQNLTQNLSYYLNEQPSTPIIYNWGIGTKTCSEAEKEGSRFLCKKNTNCINLTHEKDGLDGYRCNCTEGYSGNPYLPQGCQDIDECKTANDCEEKATCTNTYGSFNCKCPKGYNGNGRVNDRCIPYPKILYPKTSLKPVIITAGIGGSIIILLMAGFLLHWRNGERRIKQLRETFFRQNGGLILHQKLSRMDSLKIFTAQDLENATDKYNDLNIIGRGGYGIVYKGIIANNQQVAIKRSLKVDPGQLEQFINEILIFSQINNRNVVRLLGCCLETEVPLLVYEYINNGTLYDHLNDEAKVPLFTWNIRLRIATEVAEVLAYLHTTISTPIIHRDMKSMNILLDECYTAKVADFGGSRLVPVDQEQLATMVLGTLGYLDPEYMQTSELTEKSDVYSFGVVLVELLTRKKALSYQRPEVERCLAMHFLLKMKEDRLFDIIDKNIGNSPGDIEQIKKVATLAKWCLFLKGEDRPTMKEVAMELEGIKRMNKHPWQDGKSSFDQENDCEYLLRGIPKDDDGNSGGNSGKDSDLYKPPSFISSLGGGR